MEPIKDKVDKLITYNFSVTKCPAKVYDDFTDFCKSETNDNYSMGLKILLESRKANIKEVALFEQYMVLKDMVIRLEDRVNELNEQVIAAKIIKKAPKTFGKKD